MIREKGPAEYAELEAYLGEPFFVDDGRTAVAQQINSPQAEALSHENSVRQWVYKAAIRDMAAGMNDGTTQEDDVRLVKLSNRLNITNRLESHIADYKSGVSGTRLRHGQPIVLDDLSSFVRGTPKFSPADSLTRAGYIEMPTGTGKTVIFTEFLSAIHKDNERPIKSLVLVPSKEILDQTVGTPGERGFAEFAPEIPITRYFGDEKDLTGDVVVMTYQSFNQAIANKVIDNNFCDVVICDEAHRALGSVTKRNLGSFIENKLAIGLTATAEYAKNKHVKEIFPELIHVSRLREAIDDGTLAPLQCWVYKTKVQVDKDATSDYSAQELHALAQIEGRNRKGVEFAKAFVEQGQRGLISCLPGQNVKHPEIIADMLRATTIVDPKTGEIRNIRAQELSGHMSLAQRKIYYDGLANGDYDVLTFVDVINEGWDNVAAKFLINLRPTCSPVLGKQRLGRILRPDEVGSIAQVVDFIDESRKAQFIALHSLDEYRYVVGKVYGGAQPPSGYTERSLGLPADLQSALKKVDMVQVKRLVLGREHITNYSDLIPMDAIAKRFNMSPLALIIIARDGGIKLMFKGADATVSDKVYVRDALEEQLYALARRQKYAFLSKASPEALETIIRDQSDSISRKVMAANGNPEQRIRAEFTDTDTGTLVELIGKRVIQYAELPEPASQRLASAPLSTQQLATILFNLAGPGNEPLRKEVFGRMVREQYNAMYILNHGRQTGMLREVRQLPIPAGSDQVARHTVTVTTLDGRTVEVSGEGFSLKVAKYVANIKALGVVSNLSELSENAFPTLTERGVVKNARTTLHSFVQARGRGKVEYAVEHIIGHGRHMVFTATVHITLKDGTVLTAEGSGNNKNEASESAAQKLLDHEAIVAWHEFAKDNAGVTSERSQKTKKLAKELHAEKAASQVAKLSPKLKALIAGGGSVAILTQQRDKGRITDLAYTYNTDGGSHNCAITFSDSKGEAYQTVGRGMSKRDAQIAAAQLALVSESLYPHLVQTQKNLEAKAKGQKK